MVQAIGAQPSPPSARRPILPMRAVSNYQPTSVLEFSSKVARIEASDAQPSQISRHMVVHLLPTIVLRTFRHLQK